MPDTEQEIKKEDKPEDVFDQAFDEAVETAPEPVEEEEPVIEEEPPKDEGDEIEEPAEDKGQAPQEPPPQEDSEEQMRQEEKPQPKASGEREEEERQPTKQADRVDFSLFFNGLERDIEDEKERDEYVEFLKDSEDLGKYTMKTSELVGRRVINYVNESFKILVERLNPYLEVVRKQIETSHQTAIKAAHNDFEALRESGEVLSWIKEQPRYLQRTLMAVYEGGDADDVVDLISRYKKEKGIARQAEKETIKEEQKLRTREKNDKIIDDLSAVPTKVRPVGMGAKTSAADNFEDAFDEAVRAKRR